jgi:hypothetical protein
MIYSGAKVEAGKSASGKSKIIPESSVSKIFLDASLDRGAGIPGRNPFLEFNQKVLYVLDYVNL